MCVTRKEPVMLHLAESNFRSAMRELSYGSHTRSCGEAVTYPDADALRYAAARSIPRFERIRENVAKGKFIAAVVECAPHSGMIADFHLVVWERGSMERVNQRSFPDTPVHGLCFSADGMRLKFLHPRAPGRSACYGMERRQDYVDLTQI